MAELRTVHTADPDALGATEDGGRLYASRGWQRWRGPLEVIHGPRRAEPGTYDAWRADLRAVETRFEFADPPFRHSLSMSLAFAAAQDRAAAVLTGPSTAAGTGPGPNRRSRSEGCHDMVRVSLADHPLTATAALVWSGDLPRALQQVLFDTADDVTSSGPVPQAESAAVEALPARAVS